MSERILITGVPRAGKTTLAKSLSLLHPEALLQHTDSLMVCGLGWSETSDAVKGWFRLEGPWIFEGVAVVRALRKWIRETDEPPCDRLFWMPEPRVTLSPRQLGMARAQYTIFSEIDELLRQRVKIETVLTPEGPPGEGAAGSGGM